jgi:toxin-antitoxin system PIN domain toxin
MTSPLLPDVNVWLALSLKAHEHHAIAWRWYQALSSDEELAFCRITQMALLRLLTNERVAGLETLNQRQAWAVYDKWLMAGGAVYLTEPMSLESRFRSFTERTVPAHKDWTDSYLAGFAAAGSLELITFDKALSRRAKRATLLK